MVALVASKIASATNGHSRVERSRILSSGTLWPPAATRLATLATDQSRVSLR